MCFAWMRDGLTMIISGRTGVRQSYVWPTSYHLGSVSDCNVFILVDWDSASRIDARSLSIPRGAEVNKRQARRGRKPLVHSALQNFELAVRITGRPNTNRLSSLTFAKIITPSLLF